MWQAKDREITIIASQHDTTRNLHDVMEHMASNARNLEHLQTKVDLKHNLSLDERETAARSRDEQLTSKLSRKVAPGSCKLDNCSHDFHSCLKDIL